MSALQMSAEEQYRALVALGVDPAKAAKRAGWPPRQFEGVIRAKVIEFPVRIVLPWSALCSDNERERAMVRRRGAKILPAKAMTPRYQEARAKIIPIARAAMGDYPPLTESLALVARVYTPTQRRVDVANFAKGVHDALSKIVFVDDQQLQDVRWMIAGADMDSPRAEIEIKPL